MGSRTSFAFDDRAEWLETDGLGGFASGTVAGFRTRRYHALLLRATTPPTGRLVLVNGFDAVVETPSGSFALSSQAYGPDVVHPDGAHRIVAFDPDPWPHWTFRLDDGTEIDQEIFVPKNVPAAVVCWGLRPTRARKAKPIRLSVRPFLSGRDYHSLHHENTSFRFDAETCDARVVWRPYPGVPPVVAVSNGGYRHEPDWYRNFLYEEERARGLDFTEDLAAPGVFCWRLDQGEAILVFTTEGDASALADTRNVAARVRRLRNSEMRRRRFASRLEKAGDAYFVTRGRGKTIVAGYPWFTDWGRDTFVALRGLGVGAARLGDARDILLEWASTVSQGMLPNRFPDGAASPEFNSVDASLWYVVAVHDFLQAARVSGRGLARREEDALRQAIEAILDGYARGTRYAIHCDTDGLLAAGQAGAQLTWMDAKVGDWVVTPRIGKPVEVQALWLCALRIASEFSERWAGLFARGTESFGARFWNENAGCLYDVVDVDHRPGAVDSSFRPNQILAVGGLPFAPLDGERARRVVDAVEARLWTPLGLRSLAPGEDGYAGHYQGGVRERDAVYHQGTAWPWLLGPFVEAWVRVRGGTRAAKREARTRFLQPLLRHLDESGLGHISEIADGDAPHTPRGCPFQAWSVGEAIRLDRVVLGRD